MDEDQEGPPTVAGYQVMISDALSAFTSEFPEVLHDYVSRLKPHLENFCHSTRGTRIGDIDFSQLTYSSIRLFYMTLNDNLPRGPELKAYVHLFGSNVTLNYILIPTSVDTMYAVLLVCDNVPADVIGDHNMFSKFALFRNIHEGSINTLH